jgi:hypothetical protein
VSGDKVYVHVVYDRLNCMRHLQTYFTKTLFTAAGIDLYVRGTLKPEEYDSIVKLLQNHTGDSEADKELRKLANEMFKIPVGNIVSDSVASPSA